MTSAGDGRRRDEWGLVAAGSLAPVAVVELVTLIQRWRGRRAAR